MAKHLDTVSTITAPAAPESTVAEDLDRIVIHRRPGKSPGTRRFVVRAQVGGLDLTTGALIPPETMTAAYGTRPIRGTFDTSDARMGETIKYQGIDGVDREILRGDILRILAGLFFEERARQQARQQEGGSE